MLVLLMRETENHCAVSSRMQERRSLNRKVGMANLHRHRQNFTETVWISQSFGTALKSSRCGECGWVRQLEVWALSWRRFAGAYGLRVGEKPSGNVPPWEPSLVQDQKCETQACRFFLLFCPYVPVIGSACAGTLLARLCCWKHTPASVKVAQGVQEVSGFQLCHQWCGWG